MNFRNFASAPPADANAGSFSGTIPLTRQPSIYSLTFDEFQNTWGGLGKDFGSMNMDELLKNIWSAEETQAMTSGGGAGEGGNSGPPGNLQKQGSLTLPRTISQRTVDEVWKDLFKESEGPGDGNGIGGEAVSSLPQRQRTLGEMTLEEFLMRAGVEIQTQQIGRVGGGGGLYGDLSSIGSNVNNNNAGLALKLQQQTQNNCLVGTAQSPNLAPNVPRIQSSQSQQQQQQLIFPKPATLGTSQLASTQAKGMMGIIEPSSGNSVIQVGGITNGGISVAVPMGMGSPATSQLSPSVSKNTVDSSSSPIPYAFGRGRKPNGALEKVVERRQRRMIKNRESAARSRARKQAYTLELEAEVAKLKELNEELQKKQDEFMEMQKDQILQRVNGNLGNKRLCLRRTLTGPW